MRLDGYGLFVKDMAAMIRFTGMSWDSRFGKRKTQTMCIW